MFGHVFSTTSTASHHHHLHLMLEQESLVRTQEEQRPAGRNCHGNALDLPTRSFCSGGDGSALFITWLELLRRLSGFCATCGAFKEYYNSVLDIQRLTMEIISYWMFFNEAISKQWPTFLWKCGTERPLYTRTTCTKCEGERNFLIPYHKRHNGKKPYPQLKRFWTHILIYITQTETAEHT